MLERLVSVSVKLASARALYTRLAVWSTTSILAGTVEFNVRLLQHEKEFPSLYPQLEPDRRESTDSSNEPPRAQVDSA